LAFKAIATSGSGGSTAKVQLFLYNANFLVSGHCRITKAGKKYKKVLINPGAAPDKYKNVQIISGVVQNKY
jgi:predicted phosphodiesterase